MRSGRWIFAACLLLGSLSFNETLWAQQPEVVANKFDALKMKLKADGDWQKWRSFITPNEAEMKWMQIPWLATFGEGIAEAAKSDKPVLLWTMNGHPLGCT